MISTDIDISRLLASAKQCLVTPPVAATRLGVTAGTLAVWRSTGRYGLPFKKIGRKVMYSISELDEWLMSRTRLSGATA